MHLALSSQPRRKDHGLTLIEVTLVISVLLGLIAFTFIGTTAYKRGADRAICIVQVSTGQKALRSFCNLHEYRPGDSLPDLKGALIGPGRFLEDEPQCPTNGSYSYYNNEVPPLGTTFMRCSLEAHAPTTTYSW